MDIKLLNQVEKQSIGERQPLPETYLRLSDDEMDARIAAAKHTLGERLVILGHHYQRDEVIKFADFTGDSLKLARAAASKGKAEFIVFCGVHFMAESADILCAPHQKVVLPDLAAGCSMADMAAGDQLDICWRELKEMGVAVDRRTEARQAGVIPVTYINSSADIKAFCGEHGGIVCTSTNAAAIMDWAWQRGEKLVMLPDQHLGRNTAFKMGVPLDEMVVWDPNEVWGGLEPEQVKKAKLILWNGHCSVHTRFNVKQIEAFRKQVPRRQGHRAPRVHVRRRSGRRRQRLDRAHHQHRQEQPVRIDLGRGDRNPPRQPPEARRRARQDRRHARPVRVPVLDDVPRVAESSVVGARRARRGPGPQSNHRLGATEEFRPPCARQDADGIAASASSFQLPASVDRKVRGCDMLTS